MTRLRVTPERFADARPYVAIVMAAQIASCICLWSSIQGSKWSGSNDVQFGWLWIGFILLLLAFLVGRSAGGNRQPPVGPR